MSPSKKLKLLRFPTTAPREPLEARQSPTRAPPPPSVHRHLFRELLRPEQILVTSSETYFIRTSDLVATKASEHRVSDFVRSNL
ncbi:hypothetical protein NL676_012922 [Syzygium grande]|nr:hypothetical protein NL676_012922 [Syzygium grande]